MNKKLLIGFCAMVISAGALAAESGKTQIETPQTKEVKTTKITMNKNENLPGLLGKLGEKGIIVEKKFNVGKNLDGYLIKQGAQKSILYSVGDLVFSGIIFDKDGNNLSSIYADQYIPKPEIGDLISSIEQAGSFVKEGTSEREIYVFADPNCHFCEKYYKETRQLVRDGQLTIKWIPVGFLKADSMDKAAFILSSEDRVKAMQDINLGYNPGKVDDESKMEVIKNQEFMQKSGLGGTPGIMYKKNGKWIAALNGLPVDKVLQSID